MSEEISEAAFGEWAAQLGMSLEGERLQALHREVGAMYRRLAPLAGIDVGEVPVEEGAPMPRGPQG